MTDPDLHAALVALRTPPTDPAARGRALHRASLALHTASRTAPETLPAVGSAPAESSLFARLLRPVACVAFAACLFGLFFFVRPSTASRSFGTSSGAAKLLAQLEHLFPGQLNAVIDRDGALQLDLTEAVAASVSPADQGIVIDLARGGHRLRVLAHSGRPVRVELDGLELRFDPLLTADGGVVLSGDDFVWSSAAPAASRLLAGWKIEARALAPVL